MLEEAWMISRKEKIIALFASLIIAAAASALFLRGAPRSFPLDDAYIHLCYARNLAAGKGSRSIPARLASGVPARSG